MKKPIVLIIMDGVGLAQASAKNAVSLAKTPTLNKLLKTYPKLQVRAEGEFVGLPSGQMGNSEVGHLNIGAGRLIEQDLVKISNSIKNKEFEQKETFLAAIEHAKTNNSNLHLLGLISNGGVHSSIEHIIEIYKIAIDKLGENRVFIHGYLDGRDVKYNSALEFIKQIENIYPDKKTYLASISGRFYGMDRDKRWERIQKAYDVLTDSSSPSYKNIDEYIELNYSKEIYDEFVIPAYDKNVSKFISDNDSVIVLNFRSDRVREISHLFLDNSNLYDYQPNKKLKNLYFASITPIPGIETNVIFEKEEITQTIGEIMEKNNFSQLRAAESEKAPHVTFFLDGGKEKKFQNEEIIIIDSPKVETYDLKPDMSAVELIDQFLDKIENFDFAALNFANGDMVGHSGLVQPTILAIETIDKQIERIYNKVVVEMGGIILITADHGNADEMIDLDGNKVTKHSKNPVPLIITTNEYQFKETFRTGSTIAKLGDIAPTILKLFNLPQPEEMTGSILIEKKEV